MVTTAAAAPTYSDLNDIPNVDFPSNFRAVIAAKRRLSSVIREMISLRRGPGKLTPQEYFYYRLWEPARSVAEKRCFVGKLAQTAMHLASNDHHWYQTAADKILFHTIMAGAGLPVPELVAMTQAGRTMRGIPTLDSAAQIATLLRDRDQYPLFAKPSAGKYSLNVMSAEAYDQTTDSIVLLGGEIKPVDEVASSLMTKEGYLIQRHLHPFPQLASLFGPRLWSVRMLTLLQPGGPVIHRAIAKIATGMNPADNYWRPGNMLGAIDLLTGCIQRVVRGAGADLAVNECHPDTGQALVGTAIPEWDRVVTLVQDAARVFAGIRTQSWDVALTDHGPVLLEVNFGGDLNLAQLAFDTGVLDQTFRDHVVRSGYRGKL